MKNIHLIPTDKPSRLFYNVGGALLFTNYQHYNGVNIYITSDKEIIEGDWWFYICPINGVDYGDNGNPIVKNNLPNSWFEKLHDKSNYKKIILTTDQDLIKDGVQSIDDEFLEWFVKNPSCEEVELIKGFADGTDYGYNFLDYKIIIPKEEPNYNTENDGQTAVEWLIKKLQNREKGIFDGVPHFSLDGIYNQAKEMDKQQKELEFDKGWSKGWDEAVKEYDKNH